MVSFDAAVAARAEAAAAAQPEAEAPAQAEAAAAAQAKAAAVPVALPAAEAQAEGPPDTSGDNAPVVWNEFKIPEDDTDRIPEWMSDASGTCDVGDDGGSDSNNEGDSDGGWGLSLEAGLDDPEWTFGDDEVRPMGGSCS